MSHKGGGFRNDPDTAESLLAYSLNAKAGYRDGDADTTYVAAPLSHGSNPNSNMAGRRREDDENLVSFDAEQSYNEPDELAYLTRKLRRAVSSESTGVRRLTPRECERLQALPDDWTAHGPDSRRYAALGDAVTASVGEWIGRRLAA